MKTKQVTCFRCSGQKYYYQGYGIGVQKCAECDGTGRLTVFDDWRPFEQMKREDDGTHLRGNEE